MTETPQVTRFRSVHPDGGAIALALGADSPESVVSALYDVISGPAERERERDWARFRALTLPDARFLMCRWPDAEGALVEDLREWDVEGFVADARSAYAAEGFWEREVWGRTERFGSMAHRFSSYESRVGTETSEPVARGINSIQLVRHGGRWWIASVVWDVEGEGQPIPAGYLGTGEG